MSSSHEDFLTKLKDLRDFLECKVKKTYCEDCSKKIPANIAINANLLRSLDSVLHHRYVHGHHYENFRYVLEEMEVLVKEWEGFGGEGPYERKALEEKVEKMEEAYQKGQSNEGTWGF